MENIKIKINNIAYNNEIEADIICEIVNNYILKRVPEITIGKIPISSKLIIENEDIYLNYIKNSLSKEEVLEIMKEKELIDLNNINDIEEIISYYESIEEKQVYNFIERIPYIVNEYKVYSNKFKNDWLSHETIESFFGLN